MSLMSFISSCSFGSQFYRRGTAAQISLCICIVSQEPSRVKFHTKTTLLDNDIDLGPYCTVQNLI